MVAGGIVGRAIVEYVHGCQVLFDSGVIDDAVRLTRERIEALVRCERGDESVFEVRAAMHQALDAGTAVFRDGKGLEACVNTLQEVLERARRVGLVSNGLGANPELSAALKIEGQVKLALCVAFGALKRTESRGSHNSEDFPARNDRDWLNRTLACWKSESDTLPTLSYEPASPVYLIPPGDRGYGKLEIIETAEKGD